MSEPVSSARKQSWWKNSGEKTLHYKALARITRFYLVALASYKIKSIFAFEPRKANQLHVWNKFRVKTVCSRACLSTRNWWLILSCHSGPITRESNIHSSAQYYSDQSWNQRHRPTTVHPDSPAEVRFVATPQLRTLSAVWLREKREIPANWWRRPRRPVKYDIFGAGGRTERRRRNGMHFFLSPSRIFNNVARIRHISMSPPPPNSLECQPDRLTHGRPLHPSALGRTTAISRMRSRSLRPISKSGIHASVPYIIIEGEWVFWSYKKVGRWKKVCGCSLFSITFLLRTCCELLALLCRQTKKMQLVFRLSVLNLNLLFRRSHQSEGEYVQD